MVVIQSEVRRGSYYDSVVLMQLQKSLASLPGVVDAGIVMATTANLELLAANQMLPSTNQQYYADDLLIVVKAETEAAARHALTQFDPINQQRQPANQTSFRPRTLASASKQLPQAEWLLVSVPGRYAAEVAREGLRAGKQIFLYSNNVSLAEEIALKQEAQQRNLLVMGPDCGTAYINGVGLGFANRVRRGAIGLVAASGSGLQAIVTHLHQEGAGISHAIGTGGRDLSAEVGGITALQGLEWLAQDSATQLIILVSKPPAPQVATRLLNRAQQLAEQFQKPIVVYFLGYPVAWRQLGWLYWATGLEDAGTIAIHLLHNPPTPTSFSTSAHQPGYLRALFSGGTLAYEAVLSLQPFLSPLYSNVPVFPAQKLANPLHSQAHTIIDMGAEQFTQGRLHPMMDNDLRIRRLRQEVADPQVSTILLDMVLGEGAHPDPAGEFAPIMAEFLSQAAAIGRTLKIGVMFVGTEADEQKMPAQMEKIAQAGAHVFQGLAPTWAWLLNELCEKGKVVTPLTPHPLQKPFAGINIGIETFYNSLQQQNIPSVHVDWRPPAAGNEKMIALLAKLKKQA